MMTDRSYCRIRRSFDNRAGLQSSSVCGSGRLCCSSGPSDPFDDGLLHCTSPVDLLYDGLLDLNDFDSIVSLTLALNLPTDAVQKLVDIAGLSTDMLTRIAFWSIDKLTIGKFARDFESWNCHILRHRRRPCKTLWHKRLRGILTLRLRRSLPLPLSLHWPLRLTLSLLLHLPLRLKWRLPLGLLRDTTT